MIIEYMVKYMLKLLKSLKKWLISTDPSFNSRFIFCCKFKFFAFLKKRLRLISTDPSSNSRFILVCKRSNLKFVEFLKKWLINTDPSSISQLILLCELYLLSRLFFMFLELLINKFFINRNPNKK